MSVFFVGLACTLFVVVVVVWWQTPSRPLDDTDDKVTGKRSNMQILIDHGTGCQYLSSGGGLTPRLDANGKPICGGGK